ncbi:MAG: hypothetical protein B5M51_09480 [Anaerolinea sp. 4484_236]|nr:MAG: hypothetical protein B5M51_09480 [Anaerolinea sp. 4484_236]
MTLCKRSCSSATLLCKWCSPKNYKSCKLRTMPLVPQMDGIEFFKAIRRNEEWAPIPFIFLTSAASPQDIQTGKELGVEDYLTKPIDTKDLVAIINARMLRSSEVRISHINRAYLETVTVLANAIEGRDQYTGSRNITGSKSFARYFAVHLSPS